MNSFDAIFKKTLNEADEITPDRKAMEASLDDGTDSTEFDINIDTVSDPNAPTDEIADAFSRKNQQIISKLQGWIDKTSEFLTFLNGEDPNSIQSQLAAAEPDTILDKMKQSQQSKISRVASDLASFEQSLLGFMAQTRNSKFKHV